MKRRLLAIILIITMMTPFMVGCGSAGGAKDKVLAEGVLNDENLSLSADGVAMKLDAVNLQGETKGIITHVSNAPPLDDSGDIQLDVYDFKLEGVEQFAGVMELSIPLTMAAGEQPGAAWLNEETGAWEPVSFLYDEASKSVVIATDHLSKYGVFSVSNEGKRRARVEFLGLWGTGQDDDYMAAINEYAASGAPSTECLDIGAGAAGDALQLGGDFLGNIGQSAGYLAYGEDVLSTLGDHLGNLGLLVSVVQVSSNIYNGKINSAVAGSMKTAFTYILNKTASKLSSSVMSASMAAVAIVDYSINKFGTEALAGRASIYRDAYGVYYKKGNDGYKSSAYWFTTFYPLFSTPNLTEEQLKTEVDKIVTSHCNEFWTGANKMGIDYYVSEARDKFKWTAGEAGLNDEIRKEVSAERRSILYGEILPGVFQQIALKINLVNERKLREEYVALSKYLNTVITLNVVDEKKTYPNHLVRFAPLNDKAEIKNWTGKLNKDGKLTTSFTLYGHMYSGAPSTLEIFKPDADMSKDEPLKTVHFKVTVPNITILLNNTPTMDEIAGNWSEVYMTFPDVKVTPKEPGAEEGECDFTEAIVETLKAAQLKLKFEIQKVDEENANLVFGIVSGVNKNTGEAMEIDPDPPVVSPATYKDGIFDCSMNMDGTMVILKLEMKKDDQDEITFYYKGAIQSGDPEKSESKLGYDLNGKK